MGTSNVPDVTRAPVSTRSDRLIRITGWAGPCSSSGAASAASAARRAPSIFDHRTSRNPVTIWGAESAATHLQYRKWVAALSAPQIVTGFRDVRWSKIDGARRAAEAALAAPDEEQGPAQPVIRISLSDRVLTGARVTSGTLDVPMSRH